MQRIIDFIIRNRIFLIYLFLLSIALVLTFQSHSYHRSKFFKSSNWISGTVYSARENVTSYFELRGENQRLLEENNQALCRRIGRQNLGVFQGTGRPHAWMATG